MTSQVYFIGIKGQPFVKVGRSTDVASRISTFYTALPFVLDDVGRIEGGADIEKQCHKALRRCRIYGEWFDREEATALFHLIANAASFDEGIARYGERFPPRVKVSINDHKQAVASIIEDLAQTKSLAEIGRIIGVSSGTVRNARRGKVQLQPHSLFNLLAIKPDALDVLFAPYGRKTEPDIERAIEALTAIKVRCERIRRAA